MIHAHVRIEYRPERITRRAEPANFRSLGHAAAAIRLTAVRSIRSGRGPSAPGTPPHTHTRRLPKSIRYDVDRATQTALIGPAASIIGEAGAAHEHGGEYRGNHFQPRPFMRPALLQLAGRLPQHWAHSIS